MIRDWVMRGVLAGLFGNIFKEAIVWPLYWLGYVRYTFVHIAAGFFVGAQYIDNPLSLVTGLLADWTLAGVVGVMLVVFFHITGYDFAIIKGIFVGAVMYIFIYGFLMALDLTRASLLTPLPNFLLFFPHMLLGASAAWFANKLNSRLHAG